MKQTLITALAAVFIVSAPAHAISHAYRHQLAQHHRTQLDDANGNWNCHDIKEFVDGIRRSTNPMESAGSDKEEIYRKCFPDDHAPIRPAVTNTERPFVKHFEGMRIERDENGIVTVDGKLASLVESTPVATGYSQGGNVVMVYKSGKIAVIRHGHFAGYAK